MCFWILKERSTTLRPRGQQKQHCTRLPGGHGTEACSGTATLWGVVVSGGIYGSWSVIIGFCGYWDMTGLGVPPTHSSVEIVGTLGTLGKVSPLCACHGFPTGCFIAEWRGKGGIDTRTAGVYLPCPSHSGRNYHLQGSVPTPPSWTYLGFRHSAAFQGLIPILRRVLVSFMNFPGLERG